MLNQSVSWGIRVGGVVMALAIGALASAQSPFTEEAVERGIDYVTPAFPGFVHGFGLAFGDFDNDGDPDVITTGSAGGRVGVFENDGTGHFTAHTSDSGIPILESPNAVTLFDFDGDGDLDVYLPQFGGSTGNVLVRNLGGFQFEEVTGAGVHDLGDSTGSAAADYDGDGWVDLLVPNYGQPDRLYRNLGDGTFEDAAPALGLDDKWRGLQAVFFDMDWDGDADIYLSNDKKDIAETVVHNRLYENVGGTFVDISASSGADVNLFSMGVAVGDLDGNGWQDLFCTNLAVEPCALLLCEGPGEYASTQGLAGVTSDRTGWGAAFFDYDNNTFQDLYVCNRDYPESTGHNRLFVHDGSWPAVDMAPTLGVDDAANSFSLALADIDADGDIDILVQNLDDQVRLYVNHEGEKRSWAKFRISGPSPNHFAIGARVSIRTGSLWQHKQVLAGANGYLGQNELSVHFGLGAAARIDEVVVHWPDGKKRRFGHLPANRTYAISQGKVRRADVPLTPVTRLIR